MQPRSATALADPLQPRHRPAHWAVMGVSLHHIVIDAHDLPALARFWAQVLDWRILSEREREVVIGPDVTAAVGLCFMPTTEEKIVKNRLHLDLAPNSADRDAAIERILALGARRVDIGQSSATARGRVGVLDVRLGRRSGSCRR